MIGSKFKSRIKSILLITIMCICVVQFSSCAASPISGSVYYDNPESKRTFERESVGYYNGLPVYEKMVAVNRIYDARSAYELLAGISDNVFVGKVVSINGTTYDEYTFEDNGQEYTYSDPYTNYTVEVINNLKGDLPETVDVKKYGGLDASGEFYSVMPDDTLPVVGETYIFCVNVQTDGVLLARDKNSNIAYSEEELASMEYAVEHQATTIREYWENKPNVGILAKIVSIDSSGDYMDVSILESTNNIDDEITEDTVIYTVDISGVEGSVGEVGEAVVITPDDSFDDTQLSFTAKNVRPYEQLG